MNNLDKILASINSDADERIASIRKDADEKRHTVEKDYSDRIENLREKNRVKCEKERDMILSRSRSGAEMRRREILLGARVGLLDKAYADAEKYICDLDPKVYAAFLARLLCDALCDRAAEEKALAEYGEEECTDTVAVAFNKNDLASCAKTVVADALEMMAEKGTAVPKVDICPDPVNIGGGFILRLGDVETDCSVATLVAAARVDTEAECARVLFR